MLTFETYNHICKKMLLDGFPPSFVEDYDSIKESWCAMIDTNENKLSSANLESDPLTLSYLFALRWGIASLTTSDEDNKYMLIFQGLFSTISNTIFAINKLAIDGFDYQATSLIRNLYEQCFMLLAVIIDSKKRKALFDSAASEDEYNAWKKHFSFKHLNHTLQCYENKIAVLEPDSFLNTWRKRNYSSFSSYVHNDFSSFLLYGFALPNSDSDELHVNLWGARSTRTDMIAGNVNSLLWYTELLFARLLVDKDIDITCKTFCKTDTDIEFWNCASFIGQFAIKYNMQITKDEEQAERNN